MLSTNLDRKKLIDQLHVKMVLATSHQLSLIIIKFLFFFWINEIPMVSEVLTSYKTFNNPVLRLVNKNTTLTLMLELRTSRVNSGQVTSRVESSRAESENFGLVTWPESDVT